MRYRVMIESRDAEEAVVRAVQWADGAMRVVQLPQRPRMELHLALDEMVANVARHAYPEGATCRIWLSIERRADEVRVVVADRGIPFNPLRHVRAPEDAPLDQRRVGGLGIFLTTRMVDEIRYRRRDGRNTLTMVKRIASSADVSPSG